jgi:NMD protein affecting ribosome stability and mRNA decay
MLQRHRNVVVAGKALPLSAWAGTIPASARYASTINGKTQYRCSTSVHLPQLKPPVRRVLL